MTIRYKVCRSERFVHSIGSPRSLGQGEVCGTVSEGLFKGPNKPQDANLWGFEKDTKSKLFAKFSNGELNKRNADLEI